MLNTIGIIEITGPGVFASLEGLQELFNVKGLFNATAAGVKTLEGVSMSMTLGFHQPDRIAFTTEATPMYVTVSCAQMVIASALDDMKKYLDISEDDSVIIARQSGDYIS